MVCVYSVCVYSVCIVMYIYRLDDELRFLCDLDHHGNCLINRGRSPRLINVSKVI